MNRNNIFPPRGLRNANLDAPPHDLMSAFLHLQEKVRSQENMAEKLLNLEATLSEILSSQKTKDAFPEQFRAGVVAYGDKFPFPMVISQELYTQDGTSFGLTNDIARALVKIDVDNPSFLVHVSADLYKKDVPANTGLIGAFLPLSARRVAQYDPALGYQGRDFWWRVQASSDDRVWQTEWRSSAQLDDDLGRGYLLPAEYEVRRNDTITIEAQPVGPIPLVAQEYNLTFHLHIYKMLQKRG